MIASLPMYDRPANAAAHDRLWALIHRHLAGDGIASPLTLDRTVRYRDTWNRPDLVLGQICVMPYRETFTGDVTLIGASDYGLDDCDPGYFRALFVCRADDPRDLPAFAQTRFVANAKHSYSGYQSAQRAFAARQLVLPDPIISGAHDASVIAVANGTADFACIDAQTWRMQQHDLPQAQNLRVIAPSAQAPGQSFITRQSDDPAPYFAAIKHAIGALAVADKTMLGLQDIIALPADAYA